MNATLPLPASRPGPADDFPADRLMRLSADQHHRMIELGFLGEDEPIDPLRQFTVEEYHRMIDAGILTEEDRIELLDGYLVNKMARNPPHDGTMSLLLRALFRSIPDGWQIRCQAAIRLARSEPEPDLAVVRADPANYMTRHPQVADTAIVIEVSDSTLEFDLNHKMRRYAAGNVPEYWVVNIPDRQVEVFTLPSPNGYRSRQVFPEGTAVPVILDGQTVANIDVTELFR